MLLCLKILSPIISLNFNHLKKRPIILNIINYFRAAVMKSSLSAFELAFTNSDNINFARKIISVKSENAHCRLINLHSDKSKYLQLEQKINQYNFFLNIIDSIESLGHERHKYQW